MDRPLISIIITTYNYAHMVGTAIDSALRQDYPNVEVLLIDNASTDATGDLAAGYAGHPRFRYVRNDTNIGMVPNHNKGLRESRGEYVVFLSADDFLMPDHLSRSYDFLQRHPEIDVLYASAIFIDETGQFGGFRQMSGQPVAPYTGGRNEFAQLFSEGCYMCFPTMLMRRDLYDRFGELDETIKAADYEIVIRWAAAGVRFAYLPEPNCAVRIHSNQQSSPGNYITNGGDFIEFAYFIRKFITPENFPLIRGFESSIARTTHLHFRMVMDCGFQDTDGALAATLHDVERLLSEAAVYNAGQPRSMVPTIVILPFANLVELERTVRSLVAQTTAGWNALVLQHAGQPLDGVVEYLDPLGRVKILRTIAATSEATAINTAIRVAAGNCFLIVGAGAVLPPDHLERITEPLARREAEVVRTPVAAHIAAVEGQPPAVRDYGQLQSAYAPAGLRRHAFIAPPGPVESMIFTREVVDRITPFNESLAAFSEWDFYMRAQSAAPVAVVDSPVTTYVHAGAPNTFARYAYLPAMVRAVHAAYPTDDRALQIERQAYLRELDAILARGGDLTTTVAGLAELLEVAGGTRLLTAVG